MYPVPKPPSETLPTMLPSEDPEEPGLPDEFHDFQPTLLRETCVPPTYPATELLFQLQGDRYQAVSLPQAQFWFDALQLGLGVWQGAYQGVMGRWLRWYDEAGWIPTQAERAEQERQRADRLAAKLRELGIYPNQL